ncbi:thylakoid lumenal 17.4 kDa protein, chloroplastic isoform X1 [Selaginella moellendorffii]|nr:thylakoid lumenal 17.4 kDa protein, chloroplastic isoform X1 [Selaginella moellendorffii]|eukprot:XP_002991592.2 thylakoid lumenal 17.4 kDa protein, chloroplastic isoform X1 [Selaginella moellendorffii]
MAASLRQHPSFSAPSALSCLNRSRRAVVVRCCAAAGEQDGSRRSTLGALACGLCAGFAIATTAFPSIAEVRLPPLSNDPRRCERAFVGNTIGQANGVADKLLDLRFCDFTDNKDGLKGKTLSAALMADAKFDGADMTEVVMSKAYAVGASFKGTDFTNAVLDRVVFDKADMKGAVFRNTVLSGSTFQGANLENADFENALIGYNDARKLCLNPTLSEESTIELACKR